MIFLVRIWTLIYQLNNVDEILDFRDDTKKD